LVDAGRDTLRRYGFIETFFPIEPGTLVIGTGDGVTFRPIAEGEQVCVGVALDRPRTPEGFMWPTDVPGTPRATGGMGEYSEVPYPQALPSDPRERRATHARWIALALDRLLSRFNADPRHEQTGYLGETPDAVPLVKWRRERDAGTEWEWIQAENYPRGARPIETPHGVYASHSRRPPREDGRPDDPHDQEDPRGYAGPLTLTGQIVCLGAVLADHLAALAQEAAKPQLAEGVIYIAGRPDPLHWTDHDRAMFARALGELRGWRFDEGESASRRRDGPTADREPTEAGGDAEAGLLRSLFTLGANLQASPASDTITLIADVIDVRHRVGRENARHFSDGDGTPPEVKAEMRKMLLEKYAGDDPSNGARALASIMYPPTDEEWAGLIRAPFQQWFIPTIDSAEKCLRRGGGRRLSSEGHTAATVGADLLELRRLVELFLGLLPEPKPFPSTLPAQFARLGARFARAAALLRSSIDYRPGEAKPQAAGDPVEPTALLFYALNNLRTVLTQSRPFAELEDRRRAAEADDTKMRNAMAAGGTLSPAQASELLRDASVRYRDPPDLSVLARLIDSGLKSCARGREAIAKGGAKPLDAAIARDANGRPRSVVLDMQFQEAEGVLTAMSIGVRTPQIVMRGDVDAMVRLGKSVSDALSELAGVLNVTDRASDAAVTAQIPAKQDAHDGSKVQRSKVTWQEVQPALLAKRERGEPFKGVRAYAREFGCSWSTVKSAIAKSPSLKGWKARHGPKAAPKASTIGGAIADDTAQSREAPPEDALPDEEVDAIMDHLMDRAAEPEREKMRRKDAAERRELARTFLSQKREYEPSPLEPDDLDRRPRRVRQHKRA
jgi:hypothetical protein